MKKNKWLKVLSSTIAVAAVAYAMFNGTGNSILQPLSDWLSPQIKKDLQHGEMGYRQKPKSLEETMEKEDAEMMSFLDRELQVQRNIASSITVDFATEKKTQKQDKDDPLQIVLIKKDNDDQK